MPHEEASDFEKLGKALSALTASFSSFDDLLAAFGLANLPSAQRYGIAFGFLVFIFTMIAVITLLVMGGSFRRIAEQAQTAAPTVPNSFAQRKKRGLLFERLLEARDRMLKENYPPVPVIKGRTNLMDMILNVDFTCVDVADLVAEDQKKRQAAQRNIPPGYEQNYRAAYLRCQDKPGGTTLPGRPEARFEAYARAYAGCGTHTSTDYRRSYARIYESLACQSHQSDDKWNKHFGTHPRDIVGRSVRLQELSEKEHLQVVYDITCGLAHLNQKAFDPIKVWAFRSYGPFDSPEEMAESEIFQHQANQAAFALVENLTDRVIGVAMLVNDDPKNLSIQMEPPIIKPSSEDTKEQLEACFLLLDRLFAFGYRRIQMAVDVQDSVGKQLASRLGFTMEGILPKHMIVKDANRDSAIYGMLNSDWDKGGARAALFKKLHGSKMQRVDAANNVKEAELEEQARLLKEKRAMEEAEARKKKV